VPGLGFLPGLVCPHHDKVQSNGVLRATDFDVMLLRHAAEMGIGIDHWAALEVAGGRYRVISLAGKEGSVLPDASFSPDRQGVPGIWLKQVCVCVCVCVCVQLSLISALFDVININSNSLSLSHTHTHTETHTHAHTLSLTHTHTLALSLCTYVCHVCNACVNARMNEYYTGSGWQSAHAAVSRRGQG